ncbi:MAG TPA: lycopene cyclase, partial [Polyangia bacterium]
MTPELLSPETLAHLDSLERGFAERGSCDIADGGPDRGAHVDFDVVLAGGGLSLVYGAYLAQRGLNVAIFDRRRIGCGHREWNISRDELRPLVDAALFSAAEVDALVQLEYDHGICRWHGGGTWPVRRVLDCVVDAERLLDGLRARAAAAGATLVDHHALVGYRVGKGGVAVTLAPTPPDASSPPGGPRRALSARVLVDGMGAASPHAAFDLVCPTVGGVLGGLPVGDDARAIDPRVGEILVTTEGIEEDRQHIWEGFPGPGGRFTTYLFYYTEPGRLPARPLTSLYERFFATLPRYKRGPAVMLKPTYGFIPAYSRLRTMPSARDRVLLVGDAAGRHS